ncbi:dUTP diphosphatase [Agrobacterium rubi]|nr:dUTP diphosphatase [Agrobacterium rubi]NTF24355.1 dUTP diphosphatase [Agrobacterium rubi]
MNIALKILNPRLAEHGLPAYATSGSAAVDLRALIEEPVVIRPGETYKFDMGFAIDIGRADIAAIVMPRSGLGSKQGLVLANTNGLIDSDYQGPISCVALNRNQPTIRSSSFFKKFLPSLYVEEKSITVNPGDRIFQMYFVPVVQAQLFAVEEFSTTTERGTGGYGSTGSA